MFALDNGLYGYIINLLAILHVRFRYLSFKIWNVRIQ